MTQLPDETATPGRRLVSLIVPCFNEGAAIVGFYDEIGTVLATIDGIDFELICIDDGSSDETLAQLLALSRRDPRVRIIELSRNFGKEAALTAGLDLARGDAAIPIDVDLQDPPELIASFIAEWRRGAEVVLGRRVDRSSDTFLKRRSAALFYQVQNNLSGINIPEHVGDFRLIDRVAINALKQLPENQRFMKGLFAWVGFRTVVVDYVRRPRAAGTTKFSAWKLWNLAMEGITGFSTIPLRVWTYVGGLGALASLLYAIFIAVRTILRGIDVPGYASLLIVVLFFGSLQLISIGLVGEYVGRIYMESKRRPTYIVRRVYHDGRGELG